MQMPIVSALLVSEMEPFRTPLDAVELSDVLQDRLHLSGAS
jgi:hypothetical protein